MQASGLEGQVPVFVFPASLTFHIDDDTTHKQILTLYNPYDFPISYLILSNAPDKYYIIDSSGSLKPRNRLDIIVRHMNPVHKNVGADDKLRIQVSEKGRNQVLGKKDIALILCSGVPGPAVADRETFEKLPHQGGSSASPAQQEFTPKDKSKEDSPTLLVAGIFCLLAILLPTENDPTSGQSLIPPYLHLSVAVKLVLSYILGILTVIILQRL